MDKTIKLAAEVFIRFVLDSEEMKQFHRIREQYNADPEIRKMRDEFLSLTRQLQRKQHNNTLTREEIEGYKALQRKLNSQALSQEFARAQQGFIELLKQCNGEISAVLGFDFAATAAPAASC